MGEMCQDEFETELYDMDDELDTFFSEDVSGIAAKIDFSEDPLEVLEE